MHASKPISFNINKESLVKLPCYINFMLMNNILKHQKDACCLWNRQRRVWHLYYITNWSVLNSLCYIIHQLNDLQSAMPIVWDFISNCILCLVLIPRFYTRKFLQYRPINVSTIRPIYQNRKCLRDMKQKWFQMKIESMWRTLRIRITPE